MKTRKKIDDDLYCNIRTIELVRKDCEERKENILDCNANIDLLIESAEKILFICKNMRGLNNLKKVYKDKD
jgi:hypothetical protein